jgi:hypothetical protein
MATTIQKVSITHDNIIDFVIAQPSSTHREIAAAFGYSPEGIGIIVRSDAFKARLAARKDVLVSTPRPRPTSTVREGLRSAPSSSSSICPDPPPPPTSGRRNSLVQRAWSRPTCRISSM